MKIRNKLNKIPKERILEDCCIVAVGMVIVVTVIAGAYGQRCHMRELQALSALTLEQGKTELIGRELQKVTDEFNEVKAECGWRRGDEVAHLYMGGKEIFLAVKAGEVE